MRKFFSRRRWMVMAGMAAVGAASAGIAYATIPDSGGVIHGCYKASNGSLRVIDAETSRCTTGEESIEWNRTGPVGQTGATGAAGPPGAPGAFDPTRLYIINSYVLISLAGQLGQTDAYCHSGDLLMSGGWLVSGPPSQTLVDGSHPTNGANGWEVQYYNGKIGESIGAYALCLAQ